MLEWSNDQLLALLRRPEWRSRSTAAVARHTGVYPQRIRNLRDEHGLKPTIIVRRNGRPIPAKNLAGRGQTCLSEVQTRRVGELVDWCERIAGRLANDVLSQEDLVEIAHAAVLRAARIWRPKKFKIGRSRLEAEWRRYARNGVRLAIRKRFWDARLKLKRTALVGHHPYQVQVVEARMGSTLGPLYNQYTQMDGPLKLVIEGIAGLDGHKPWGEAELAAFWCMDLLQARTLIERAKAELAG